MNLKILKYIGFFVTAFSLSSLAFANKNLLSRESNLKGLLEPPSYARGSWTCFDFEHIKNEHLAFPKAPYAKIDYALCLIVRGEDDLGLKILKELDNYVLAAFLRAEYVRTDGALDKGFSHNKLDEAADIYSHILDLTGGDSSYPNIIEKSYEQAYQLELYSSYRAPYLYVLRYFAGFAGSHNAKLAESSGFSGGKAQLELWENYRSSTQESLEKALLHAERCLSLPKKKHFQDGMYFDVKSFCRTLKELALALQPLEEERLKALSSCGRLAKAESGCPEYYKPARELHRLGLEAGKQDIKEILKIMRLNGS